MKISRGKATLGIIISVIIIIAISMACYYKSVINRPLKLKSDFITIDVKEGEGFSNIIENLSNKGILRNKLIVKLKVKLDNDNINLLPGSYDVKKDVTLKELVNILQSEDVNKNIISVTFPEGYNIDDIASELERNKLFSKEEFIEAINNYKLPTYVKNNSKKKYNLEGYLYPDTYKFEKDSTPEDVIKIMIDEFEKKIKEIENETGIDINDNNMEEVITKASLIEKEVVVEDEKKLVSSVINNRLSKNMKLQFCSSVNYVIGYEGHKVLTYSDIEVDSPYNTYKYAGLPVGPICSPSLSSIIAALEPADTDYLYFVSNEDLETHYFSKTIEEHEAAKAKLEGK